MIILEYFSGYSIFHSIPFPLCMLHNILFQPRAFNQETFVQVPVRLGAASTATVLIVDDDHAGAFGFESEKFKVSESAGEFVAEVVRTRGVSDYNISALIIHFVFKILQYQETIMLFQFPRSITFRFDNPLLCRCKRRSIDSIQDRGWTGKGWQRLWASGRCAQIQGQSDKVEIFFKILSNRRVRNNPQLVVTHFYINCVIFCQIKKSTENTGMIKSARLFASNSSFFSFSDKH